MMRAVGEEVPVSVVESAAAGVGWAAGWAAGWVEGLAGGSEVATTPAINPLGVPAISRPEGWEEGLAQV